MLDPEQLVLCSILCQEQSESLHKTESVTVGEDAAQKPDIYAPLQLFQQ